MKYMTRSSFIDKQTIFFPVTSSKLCSILQLCCHMFFPFYFSANNTYALSLFLVFYLFASLIWMEFRITVRFSMVCSIAANTRFISLFVPFFVVSCSEWFYIFTDFSLHIEYEWKYILNVIRVIFSNLLKNVVYFQEPLLFTSFIMNISIFFFCLCEHFDILFLKYKRFSIPFKKDNS